MRNPFSDYLSPTTMTQQRASKPSWLNVGYGGGGNPFGGNKGDISGAGWQNPIDVFTQQAEREMAKMAGLVGPTGTNPPGALGSPNDPKWAQVNQWDAAIQSAAAKWGVDPNRIKAHMMIESGGVASAVQNNPTNGNTYGLMQINPAIWGGVLRQNGIDMNTPEGNIEGAAYILSTLQKQYGSWDAASSAFFTGNPNWQGADTVNGTTGSGYRDMLNTYMSELTGAGGKLPAGMAGGPAGAGGGQAVQAAISYVGKIPYVLGGIPGRGETPQNWDCSGMMYWLDQNYGKGDLPMGSHEQYSYGLQTGRLAMREPAVGDLVFFNTGASFRGNAASHVGIYIGNGQFVHAANPDAGTITSDFNQYKQMYQFMGSMTMSWSGGSAYNAPIGTGQSPTYGYGSGSLFGNWSSLMDPSAAWRSYRR